MDIEKTLNIVAEIAQDRLENYNDDTVEFGYYLGVMNLASQLSVCVKKHDTLPITTIDYKTAKKLWELYQDDTNDTDNNQISMEDIIPGILSSLKNIAEKIKDKDNDKEKKK